MAGAHAIVLGASMAGLLAARVLADSYRAVTLVERDELPGAVANRRGVPQGRHAHGLLGRGSLILADLFPGFEAELVTADAAGHPAGNGGGHHPEPGRPTGMTLFGYENDTWMFTAFGMAGREPPTEPVDRLAFVEAITPPHIMRALRDALPLSDICRYRYPENRWRRYDKMRRFPEGLLRPKIMYRVARMRPPR